jgi:hypothetical protein
MGLYTFLCNLVALFSWSLVPVRLEAHELRYLGMRRLYEKSKSEQIENDSDEIDRRRQSVPEGELLAKNKPKRVNPARNRKRPDYYKPGDCDVKTLVTENSPDSTDFGVNILYMCWD